MAADVLVAERRCVVGDPVEMLRRFAAGVSLGEEALAVAAELFDFGVVLPDAEFDRRVAVAVAACSVSLVVFLLSCRPLFNVADDRCVFSCFHLSKMLRLYCVLNRKAQCGGL